MGGVASSTLGHTFLSVEITTLRNEVESLKKCQVDFIRLSTILFGLTITGLATITPHIDKIKDLENTIIPFESFHLLIYILILSFISLCYPYIMWIIIHKCRSIFRIVGYIRLVENGLSAHDEDNQFHYQGYERLHRKLKENRWLTHRIKDFNKYFPRIKREIMTYRQAQCRADNSSFPRGFDFRSCDGLDKTNEPYIGNYYGKLLFYLKLTWFINSFLLILIAVYGGLILDITPIFEKTIYIGFAVFFLLWTFYHLRVTRRQLNEIRYRPFSIDAHYDMWRWASAALKAAPSSGVDVPWKGEKQ